MPLYTPFFERNTAKVADARRMRDIRQAASAAYGSGDLSSVYAQDPALAAQMERTQLQERQVQNQEMQIQGQQEQQRQRAQALQQQEQAELAQQRQEATAAFHEEMAPFSAQFDNIEDFNNFVANQASVRGIEGAELIDQANFDLLKQAFPSDEGTNQRSQKIDALATMYGDAVSNPVETATKMVDGIIDVEFLEDGTVMMTDKSLLPTDPQNAVTYLPVGTLETEVPRAEPEAGQSLWELAPLVAGAGSAIRAGASAITGQAGLPVAEQTIEARQTFTTAKNNLIRAMSINPRFPVGEIDRIREEINIAPRILDSEDGLKARMRSIDRSLRNDIAQAARDAGDRSLSEDIREDARTRGAAMQNFLDNMGVPQKVAVEDLTMEYLEEVDADNARSIIRDMTEEEYNMLPIGVINALREKAGG